MKIEALPNITIKSLFIINHANGVALTELLEINEETLMRNNDNEHNNLIMTFTQGTTSYMSEGVHAFFRSLKSQIIGYLFKKI